MTVKVSDQRVGAGVYGSSEDAQAQWWKKNGIPMVEQFARAWRAHVDPEKFSDKEITGKLLSSKVCNHKLFSTKY